MGPFSPASPGNFFKQGSKQIDTKLFLINNLLNNTTVLITHSIYYNEVISNTCMLKSQFCADEF
jgi:hypothetical protein